MKRLVNKYLSDWRVSRTRKPLLMRGARQVGKTHAVRKLGEAFEHILEINFEKKPELCNVFEKDLDPKRILIALTAVFKQAIIPGKTLLFFDEVQACPKAIIALRYFYEELPELHVVAAGSLLDFAIEQVGLPVGRVSFCYVYPVSFMEYLVATGHTQLFEMILNHPTEQPMEDLIHKKLFDLLGEYMLLGGMPEIIKEWIQHRDFVACSELQHNIIGAYREDFPKYAKKVQIKYVEALFNQIPHMIGEVFKFSRVQGDYQKRELEPALQLLIKAGIVHKIEQTSGNGFPLGANVNLNRYKLIFLDMALAQAMLGIQIEDWLLDPLNAFVNKGMLAESFVGQEFLSYAPCHIKEKLYYWHREERGSIAEVDFIKQINEHIIPAEVKGGKGTTLKSLHLFLENHAHSPYGIRFSTLNYSIMDKLHSYPLYAISGFLAKNHPEMLDKLSSLL